MYVIRDVPMAAAGAFTTQRLFLPGISATLSARITGMKSIRAVPLQYTNAFGTSAACPSVQITVGDLTGWAAPSANAFVAGFLEKPVVTEENQAAATRELSFFGDGVERIGNGLVTGFDEYLVSAWAGGTPGAAQMYLRIDYELVPLSVTDYINVRL